MILFKDGAEADRLVGALPKPLLKSWIDQTVGGGSQGSATDVPRRSV
jgi:thioredoxin-like negative regulator of GroEL